MKSLSLAHVRRLNDAVLHLYDQVAHGEFENAAIGMIQRLVPAENYMVGLINSRTGHMTGRVVPELENLLEITASFNRWAGQHPAIGRRAEQAQSISEHLSRREWHRLDLYAEAFRPTGMEDDLALEVDLGDRHSLMIGNSRTRRNFTREDRLLLTLAGPHLRAAWHQSQATLRAPLPSRLDHEPGPHTAEFNAAGRALAYGAGTIALFQSYFGADPGGSNLPGELREWFRKQQTTGFRQPFQARNANGHLTIHYVKDSAGARHFLVLSEQCLHPEIPNVAGLEGLGLTRREQEVLYWVAQGKTNATVARVLGISPGTIKRHLENIYARLGVESRHGATLRALESLQENRHRPGWRI